MAQVKRDTRLDNRSSRKTLEVSPTPYWLVLEQGRALGYRKGKKGGTWLARLYTPDLEKKQHFEALGAADDFSDPDGVMVLSFAQAQAKAREWFKVGYQQATGELVIGTDLTVDEVIDLYLADRRRAGAAVAERLKWDFGAWVRPALGALEARKLTRKRIEDWMDAVASSPKRRRGGKLAPAPETPDEKRARRNSANRVWTYFRAALNHAAAEGLLDASAWSKVEAFRGVEDPRVRFLTVKEQVRLVKACPQEDFRRLVQAGLFTGARESELARLEARDFNPATGQVFIEKSKSKKSRHIDLTEEAVAFFEQMTAGLRPGDLIFPRRTYSARWAKRSGTGGWSRSQISELLGAALTAAKIEPLVFHELRHTYASGLVNRGVPLPFVAAQLGHRDTKMVEKHYGHLCPSAKAESVRRLAPRLSIFRTVEAEERLG